MKKRFILGLLLSIVLLTGLFGSALSNAEHQVFLPFVSKPFEAMYNLSAPDCSYGGEIKSIEAVDQTTVKFTLCTPDAAFLSKLSFPAFGIQSAEYLVKTGGGGTELLTKPIGSGPYKLDEWAPGSHMSLVPNPYYRGPAPTNQEFVLRWNGDAAARLLELQAGTADVIDTPMPEDFAAIQADLDLKLLTRNRLDIFYLGLNNTIAPFGDEKVRQALAMAIDRQKIVDDFYPPGSLAAEQFVPPALAPGYIDGFKWWSYNVTAAQQLLSTAGFPTGFATTLYYRDVVRAYLPSPGLVAQEIQSQLALIGVMVTIQPMENIEFLTAVNNGQLGMFMLGWTADYPDPTNFYDPHFTGLSQNFGNAYPDLVTAIQAAGQVADPTLRNTLYASVAALVKQHVPMIPIAHSVTGIAYRAGVEGAQASPLSFEMFNLMAAPGHDELNFIQDYEPASLYCSDETDMPSLRPCYHIFDTLYWYTPRTAELVPAAAESHTASADLKTWTITLKKNLKFSDGTALDANDVVQTFVVQWDASNPLHVGNSGGFEFFSGFFTRQLNAP